jgi:GNAT superfamily N-acetyltransferase
MADSRLLFSCTSDKFVGCDPEEPPASELLAEMSLELNAMYWTSSRLDVPPAGRPARASGRVTCPARRLPGRWEGTAAVGGGGLRRYDDGVAEIKRMFVRPAARSRGVAAELLAELEEAARSLGYRRARLDTGAKQTQRPGLYPPPDPKGPRRNRR